MQYLSQVLTHKITVSIGHTGVAKQSADDPAWKNAESKRLSEPISELNTV